MLSNITFCMIFAVFWCVHGWSITVHFIALRLGRAIMHQHSNILLKLKKHDSSNDFRAIIFLYFPDGNWPPCWIFKSIKFYLLKRFGGSRHIIMPHFVEIGPSIAEILRLFELSRWPSPPSWIFEIAKFYWQPRSRGLTRITVQISSKFGQSIVEILQIFNFARWRSPPY